MARFFFLLIINCLLLTGYCFAQNPAMSKDTKVINGKKYYIHKVAKGQSLYGIAKIYDVDLNALIVENPEAIDGIKTGQELKIPTEKPKEQSMPTLKDYEKYITHKVVKGETVYRICKEYNITEQQLTTLNPNIKNGLKENMVLRVKEKDATKVQTVTTHTTSAKTEVKETPVIVKEKETTEPVLISKTEKDTTPVEVVNKPKKNKYNVGLFLPFHFDDLSTLNIDELVMNKQEFPSSSHMALDIYEGLQQAADSLKTDDFEIVFKLYDSGDIDSLTTIKLTKTNDFKNLDLIIGPLYNSPFKIISTEAKKNQIPCVSPLTQQNKVLFNNVFTSKLIPSNNTLLQGLADYCLDSLKGQNIVLLNNGSPKDIQTIKTFKAYYNQKTKDTLTEVKGVVGAKAAYKADKQNFYVVLSENEPFITEFLTQLNLFSDKKENLRVIGLRKWMNYDNLDLEYFNNFSFTCAVPYYIDDENPYIQKLKTAYQQKYTIAADDYYYVAADAGLYYFNLLKTMGAASSVVLDDMPKLGTCINFSFTHPNNTTGFENQAIQLIRYNDYKLRKVQYAK
jgi:LysM repeat protein/ABC-type branched-subunit amino acid transport system substrate-binding protein